MKNLEILFEKYKFDYICINPRALEYLEWEWTQEELLADFIGKPAYLGTIKLKDKNIDVFFDDKIKNGSIALKYNNIKKERKIKINNLLNLEE